MSPAAVLVIQEGSDQVEDILRGPVELIDEDLDVVAGGAAAAAAGTGLVAGAVATTFSLGGATSGTGVILGVFTINGAGANTF
jgi:hypothetical protein